ncbi:MAG: acetylornithine deacetylase [Gammaproteobacteria bacterium]|nr:acetylornithine deacetylase [Gammaproteobacteria bacterium]
MHTVDAQLLSDIAELVRLPSISSFSPELDMSNRPVVDWLAERLERRGFDIAIQDVPGVSGKSNLIATLGRGDGGLVLSGHTDTVPFDAGKWTSDPFQVTEREGRLYGLGTADMKSFFALVLAATQDLRAESLRVPLIVLATADEETSMSGARALTRRSRIRATNAVIGEPTDFRPVRLHKGIFMERICIEGSSGHSGDPGQGVNALEGMQHVIHELLALRSELQATARNEAFPVPVTTLNLGRIAGGDNPNRICGHCELDIDLRMLPGMTVAETRSKMRARVSRALADSGMNESFEVLFEGIDPLETPADAELVRLTEKLTGSESRGVVYGTEGPFLSALGMDVVILGPGSIDQAHQSDEFLRLDGLRDGVGILRELIRELCLSD